MVSLLTIGYVSKTFLSPQYHLNYFLHKGAGNGSAEAKETASMSRNQSMVHTGERVPILKSWR